MNTIAKFEIKEAVASIVMPRNAHVVSVQSQADEPWQNSAICIFAEIDTEVPCEVREFRVIATNQELPNRSLRYIGSCMIGKSSGDFHKPIYVVPTVNSGGAE